MDGYVYSYAEPNIYLLLGLNPGAWAEPGPWWAFFLVSFFLFLAKL